MNTDKHKHKNKRLLKQLLDGGGQGFQGDFHHADHAIPAYKNHIGEVVIGWKKEVIEQSPFGIGDDGKCQCMTAPKLDGLFRWFRDINCHQLETAASVLVPKVLEMRSLRIALPSPGSEEVEQDYFARSVWRGELDCRQATPGSQPGVRSPLQIGDYDRRTERGGYKRNAGFASHTPTILTSNRNGCNPSPT